MDDFWGLAVVLVVMVMLYAWTIVAVYRHWGEHSGRVIPRRRLSDTELKAGDLVLYLERCHSFINSLLTGDMYTHASIVVEAPDGGLHLSEVNLFANGGRPQVYPLVAQLNDLTDAKFLFALERPLTAAQKRELHRLATTCEVPYPSGCGVAAGLLGINDPEKTRNCMQHVGWLLDGIGLTPAALLEEGETVLGQGFVGVSHVLSGIAGVPLGGGAAPPNRYSGPAELLIDVGEKFLGPPGQGSGA